MAVYDLIVRDGNIIGAALAPGDGPTRSDAVVADAKIAAVAPDLGGTGDEEVYARGPYVFPGAIDAHAHSNEPGRSGWEGFATGTQALAAGGATAYVEMPLNAYPPTLDAESFDLKLRAAKASSLVGFALWGTLVPGPVERPDDLFHRYKTSPYVGRTFLGGNVVRTVARHHRLPRRRDRLPAPRSPDEAGQARRKRRFPEPSDRSLTPRRALKTLERLPKRAKEATKR